MPLFKTITPNSNTLIKIWHITESYAELMAPLTLKPESISRVLNMKSALHQCGFLSIRQLLNTMGYSDLDLFYDAFGKPHLSNGKHISITHSFQFSAVIISDSKVGIDIEMQRTKIAQIAHKFIDYECAYVNPNCPLYINTLTQIWCIKEALYKLYATPGLSFKQHCMVIPSTTHSVNTVAWINYLEDKKKYGVEFLEFEGFTCAYVIE